MAVKERKEKTRGMCGRPSSPISSTYSIQATEQRWGSICAMTFHCVRGPRWLLVDPWWGRSGHVFRGGTTHGNWGTEPREMLRDTRMFILIHLWAERGCSLPRWACQTQDSSWHRWASPPAHENGLSCTHIHPVLLQLSTPNKRAWAMQDDDLCHQGNAHLSHVYPVIL